MRFILLLILPLMAHASGVAWIDRAYEALQYHVQGRLPEARSAFEESLRLAREQGRHPIEQASILNRMASVSLESGDLTQARRDLQQAEAMLADYPEKGRKELIVCLMQQSILAFRRRRFHHAVETAREALRNRELVSAKDVPARAEIQQQLAASLHADHKEEEALKEYREAQMHCTESGGCAIPLQGALAAGIGLLSAQNGDSAGGLKELERAVALLEKDEAPPMVLYQPINNLAILYLRSHRTEDARRLLERSLPKAQARLGPEHPMTASMLLSQAAVFEAQGRKKEAREVRHAAEQTLTEWERRNELHYTVEYGDLLSRKAEEGSSRGR